MQKIRESYKECEEGRENVCERETEREVNEQRYTKKKFTVLVGLLKKENLMKHK